MLGVVGVLAHPGVLKELGYAGRVAWLLAIIWTLGLDPAHARDFCQSYGNVAPAPDWYSAACSQGSASQQSMGDSFSSIGAALSLNFASLPTLPLPPGAEFILTPTQTGNRTDFAFAKGFQKTGVGLSTSNEDSFYENGLYSPSVNSSASATDPGLPSRFHLGSAVSLAGLFPEGSPINAKLGGGFRVSRSTGTIGSNIGVSVAYKGIFGSFSNIEEARTKRAPNYRENVLTLGLSLGLLKAEYVTIYAQAPVSTSAYSTRSPGSTRILSATMAVGRLLLTAAHKSYETLLLEERAHIHAAAQWMATDKLSFGIYHGYLEREISFGAQIFF